MQELPTFTAFELDAVAGLCCWACPGCPFSESVHSVEKLLLTILPSKHVAPKTIADLAWAACAVCKHRVDLVAWQVGAFGIVQYAQYETAQ